MAAAGCVGKDIIDETGAQAVVIVKSGLMSLRTNPSVQWFRSQTPDEDLNLYMPVRKWLWKLDAMARRILVKSRSNIALPHPYGEAAVFGTSPKLPKGMIINGRVDRLVVTPDRVLVIDFKTDQPAPDDVSEVAEGYITQMASSSPWLH